MPPKKCGTCRSFKPDRKDEVGVGLRCAKKDLNVQAESNACEAHKK